MSPASTTTTSVVAVSSAVHSPPSAPPSTMSATTSSPRCCSGAGSGATSRGTTPSAASIARWRATIVSPPTSSSGLARAAQTARPASRQNRRRPRRHPARYATRMTTHAGFTDDGIGRILVASLHHGIGDAMPMRLEYYEHWLGPMGLRDSRGGLAPLGAVLSFLRLEGQAVYDDVMTRAGRSSAEWHRHRRSRRDALARALPQRLAPPLRAGPHAAAWCGRPSIRRTPRCRRGGDTRRVDIEGSVFCALRDPWPWPTCTYFRPPSSAMSSCAALRPRVAIDACRASGAAACRLDRGLHARVGADAWSLRMIGACSATAAAVCCRTPAAGRRREPGGSSPRGPSRWSCRSRWKSSMRASAWLGEGTAIGLTAALAERGVEVVGRDERLAVFERLQLPPGAALTRATIIKVAELVGATRVILGRVAASGTDVVIEARVAARGHRPAGPAAAPRTAVSGLLADLSRRWRGAAEGSGIAAAGTRRSRRRSRRSSSTCGASPRRARSFRSATWSRRSTPHRATSRRGWRCGWCSRRAARTSRPSRR